MSRWRLILATLRRSPWLWSALAAALAAALGWAYHLGHQHAADACAAERLASVERAIAQADALAREDADILRAEAKARAETRVRYRTITREVIRYVASRPDLSDCGLDVDGLRLWRAANAGGRPDPAGGSGAGVPGAADAGIGPAAGPDDQPR